MQDEKKSHGKAGACRGFLTKYCAKSAFLKQFLSFGTSPFAAFFDILFRYRTRTMHSSVLLPTLA